MVGTSKLRFEFFIIWTSQFVDDNMKYETMHDKQHFVEKENMFSGVHYWEGSGSWFLEPAFTMKYLFILGYLLSYFLYLVVRYMLYIHVYSPGKLLFS